MFVNGQGEAAAEMAGCRSSTRRIVAKNGRNAAMNGKNVAINRKNVAKNEENVAENKANVANYGCAQHPAT
ncbi:hypothetical protein [Heyndrickxia acidicola]|uniref:Uncharacterized protein n=1 Tax=Heyndrickxia acidicola TaxID=209389 RepID=A0ABU6MG34_9BACI|nr:hypothetical protein [Heyndrickxia acidicola]MED1203373.1 hypothetical protein [Heyndrickxia acidicola]